MTVLQVALQLSVTILTALASRNYVVQGGADLFYVGGPAVFALAAFIASTVLHWLQGKPPTLDDAQQLINLISQLLNAKNVKPETKLAVVQSIQPIVCGAIPPGLRATP